MSTEPDTDSNRSLVGLTSGIVTILVLTLILAAVAQQLALAESGPVTECTTERIQLDRTVPAKWEVVDVNPPTNTSEDPSKLIEDDYEVYGQNNLPPAGIPHYYRSQYIGEHLWQSGTQQEPGFYVVLDVKTERRFNRVVLDSRPEPDPDWPNDFAVSVRSEKGESWDQIGEFTSNSAITTANFDMQTARYVKIELLSSKDWWWSINEIFLFRINRCDGDNQTSTPEGGTSAKMADLIPSKGVTMAFKEPYSQRNAFQ